MKFKIIHTTEYHFSSEVFFEPHYLRFRPKTTAFNNLEFFDLQFSPSPIGISEQSDTENNLIHFCWFEDLTKIFKIRAESLIEIKEHNPLNFILYPSSYLNFPFQYEESLRSQLAQSLTFESIKDILIEYGKNILIKSKFNTIEFLTNITNQIHSDFIVESRPIGIPFKADKTYELKKGSCRDLVWMQIQLFRYMGIASRFVSGYYYLPIENSSFELHAWLEVFLPGAGWIGLDPSHGVVAGNSHIPVASSSHFENTMPVTGTIRGDASSELISDVLIELV